MRKADFSPEAVMRVSRNSQLWTAWIPGLSNHKQPCTGVQLDQSEKQYYSVPHNPSFLGSLQHPSEVPRKGPKYIVIIRHRLPVWVHRNSRITGCGHRNLLAHNHVHHNTGFTLDNLRNCICVCFRRKHHSIALKS